MASSLAPAELLERQSMDHRLIEALNRHGCGIHVTGHRSAAHARANREPVGLGATPPSHYRVVYDFETLSGPGKRHRPTVVHIAPLANRSYPATPPAAWVISKVVPWTPHFAANVPICHGIHVWIPYRTQLHDFIIHLGKLLNFDEPLPKPGYHGYNGTAIAYWRDHMRFQPLDPGLHFPIIRAEDVLAAQGFAPTALRTPGSTRFRGASGESPSVARFAHAASRVGRFRAAEATPKTRFSTGGVRP